MSNPDPQDLLNEIAELSQDLDSPLVVALRTTQSMIGGGNTPPNAPLTMGENIHTVSSASQTGLSSGNEHEMNPASGIQFLNRSVNQNTSVELCNSVEQLLQGPEVISQENFKWVACGWRSKELDLCQRFLTAGLRESESDSPNHPLRRYSKRGLPKVVHYIPVRPSLQSKKPYFICPLGYEDAVVVIRAYTDAEQYLPVYEVDPSTTIREIQGLRLRPGRYAITFNELLVVPHQTKIELPTDCELKFVCQMYSTDEPSTSSLLLSEDDVCPFMRRFWRVRI